MRRLTDRELTAASEALLGPDGRALREAVCDFGQGRPVRSPDGLALAEELGWIEGADFTELGRPIGDPLREFVFWERRDRVLLSSDLDARLEREAYAGQHVLELGSGGGCNLLSLSGLPGRFVGLDPMPVCLQLMPVLAEMAGLPTPEAVEASAENIPFADDEFDVVLCYSSHQYMDLNTAIAEMDRVVNDTGEAIIIGGRLGPFVPEVIGRFFSTRSIGGLWYDTKSIVNTIGYQLLGRRVIVPRTASPTSMPIYTTSRWLEKTLEKNNFVVRSTTRLPGSEVALVAGRG